MDPREAEKKGVDRAEKYTPEEQSEQTKRGTKTAEERQPGFHSDIGKKEDERSRGAQNRNRNE